MRILITEKDLSKIVGRFVVELEKEKEYSDIRSDFHLEKRIRFVSLFSTYSIVKKSKRDPKSMILLSGVYGSDYCIKKDRFIKDFNGEGRDRFYRLLTSRELSWLLEEMKKMIY